MKRWSTPLFTIKTDVDLSNADSIWVDFAQNGETILSKQKADLGIADGEQGSVLSFRFSQAETSLFKADHSYVLVQVTAKIGTTRLTSDLMQLKVDEVLRDEAI